MKAFMKLDPRTQTVAVVEERYREDMSGPMALVDFTDGVVDRSGRTTAHPIAGLDIQFVMCGEQLPRVAFSSTDAVQLWSRWLQDLIANIVFWRERLVSEEEGFVVDLNHVREFFTPTRD
jgi:hypothetical protein